MKIPFYTPYQERKNARQKMYKQIELMKKKSLQEDLDLQNSILEARKKVNEVIINIQKPKHSLSDELYSNNDFSSYVNIGWWGFDNAKLRRASRIAYWESNTGRAIINRLVDTVVGAKLDLQSNPIWSIIKGSISSDKDAHKIWTKTNEDRFKNWASQKTVDYIRERNFHQLTGTSFFYLFRDGEYFAVLRYNINKKKNPLTIQLIPPENIQGGVLSNGSKNKLLNGIEYNQKDEAIAYHIYDEKTGKTKRIPKSGPRSGRTFVIHTYLKDNEKQRRGIPHLSSSIPSLTKLSDAENLELQALVINAMIAIWIEPPANQDGRPTISKSGISAKTTTLSSAESKLEWNAKIETMNMKHGGIVVDEIPAGHKIQSFDTKRPNANFAAFLEKVKRGVTASMNIPLSVVDFDFKDSYSSIRGQLLLFWNTVTKYRLNHGWDFCDEVYKMWMWGEIDNDKIEAEGWQNEDERNAWSNATWNGNQRPDIDPLKSVNSNIKEHTHGYKTGQQIAAERGGGDYNENLEMIDGEFKSLAKAVELYYTMTKAKTK